MKPITTLASLSLALALLSCDSTVSEPTENMDKDTTMVEDSVVQSSYMDISADSVMAMLTMFDGIYDVSPYYVQGHLPYAMDAGGVDGLKTKAMDLDPNGKYLVYCHADAPSIAGAEAMIAAGLKNVYRLEGNYGAWDAISYVDVAPKQVDMNITTGMYDAIYDVSPYHAQGHLPGAIDASGTGTLAALIADQDKGGKYLVYCHGDAPSMAGAQLMEDAGFTNVHRLEGNFGAWKDGGYTVEMDMAPSYMDISADSVMKMLTMFDGIYDVSPHYAEGHLPYAMDAGGVDGLKTKAMDLDPNGKYLVYCHADAPSIAGAEALIEAGMTNVYRLEGNYGGWDAISYVDVAPKQVDMNITAGDYDAIFDVSPHHGEEHLPGAIDAYNKLAELIADQDKAGKYLVYCHADGPSMAGAQLMEDAGFTNVHRLEGNFGAWKDGGYTVEMDMAPSYMDISADSVMKMLTMFDGIYDVSPAYDMGHLPYAMDAGGVDGLKTKAMDLDPNGKYLVYCHADAPSIAGAEALIEAGMTNVYRLEGNYGAWDAISFVDVAPKQIDMNITAGDYDAIYDVSPYYTQGHLPGAIDAYNKLAELIADQDKGGKYLVYCHGDAPSMAGAQLMEDAGFTDVHRLEGNFGAWKDGGYTVE